MAPKGKGAPATGGGGRGTGGGGVGRGGARAGAGKKAKSLGLTGRPPDKTEQTTTLLMTICSLGEDWLKDPSSIPVEEIVEVWREQSGKGRYEAAMWRAAGLEEPRKRRERVERGEGGAVDEEGGLADVDNLAAGGFFGWMGRDRGEAA